MDKKKGNQHTVEKHSAGNARNDPAHSPSGKDHRSGDVSSDHANGPAGEEHRGGDEPSHNGDGKSNEDLGSRTGGATERANILSNNGSGLKVKLFERGTPVIISVSRDVAVRAATAGVSVNVGDNIRIPLFENAEKVDSIFKDM